MDVDEEKINSDEKGEEKGMFTHLYICMRIYLYICTYVYLGMDQKKSRKVYRLQLSCYIYALNFCVYLLMPYCLGLCVLRMTCRQTILHETFFPYCNFFLSKHHHQDKVYCFTQIYDENLLIDLNDFFTSGQL
jgi:hypothetical protein